MKRNQSLDKTITIRLPFDLLDRLEDRVHKANAVRAEAKKNGDRPLRGENWEPLSISEMIRGMLKCGLDVTDRGDEAREWFYEIFGDELLNVLAIAVHDKKARATLEAIAKKGAQEALPDFG